MSAEPQMTTLETLESPPAIRMRIEHSRTIKDGWSYSTTVEISGETSPDEIEMRMYELLHVARDLGERERDARNARDAAAKAVGANTEQIDPSN